MRGVLIGLYIFGPLLVGLVLLGRFAYGESWRAALAITGASVLSTALFVLWVHGVLYLAGGE